MMTTLVLVIGQEDVVVVVKYVVFKTAVSMLTSVLVKVSVNVVLENSRKRTVEVLMLREEMELTLVVVVNAVVRVEEVAMSKEVTVSKLVTLTVTVLR